MVAMRKWRNCKGSILGIAAEQVLCFCFLLSTLVSHASTNCVCNVKGITTEGEAFVHVRCSNNNVHRVSPHCHFFLFFLRGSLCVSDKGHWQLYTSLPGQLIECPISGTFFSSAGWLHQASHCRAYVTSKGALPRVEHAFVCVSCPFLEKCWSDSSSRNFNSACELIENFCTVPREPG